MSSLDLHPQLFTPDFSPHRSTSQAPYDYWHSSHAARAPQHDSSLCDATILTQAFAALQSQASGRMNDQYDPNVHSQPLPLGWGFPQESLASDTSLTDLYDWQSSQASMGGPVVTPRPLKRSRSHQRTPSTSTVASNGPASPYTTNTSYPQIANTDYSPNSPAQFADNAFFSKGLPIGQQASNEPGFTNSSGHIPSQVAHTPNAHLAMKGFAIDHHTVDDYPEFYQSSRPSLSSHGNDSPTTPQSGMGEHIDSKSFNANQNDFRQPSSNVQLYRTESQAYQDELYNPNAFSAAPVVAVKQQRDFLSPHRNLVTERLQNANLARSSSPISAVSRERSPFREGSRFATTDEWGSPINASAVGTAASMRQQQKEQAEQNEYAQHMPQLEREPTKTISPKDAVLEYNDSEQPPLFQENIPAGYKQHPGGTELWQSNFVGQPGSTFGNLTAGQHITPFRASSADGFTGQNFGFIPLPPTQQDPGQIPTTSAQTHACPAPKMTFPDANPEFPANLTSMESSVSESNVPPSSQDSYHNTSAPQRPADTRANTGTYTCTYHGCIQRFDSHANLQKHKREYHRSQQQKEVSPTSAPDSDPASPRSTESPAPSNSGLTSAAILARNSQAGPHKCSRINPSTNKPCNTIFSRPYDLTRHEDTIHNNRKQKVRCPMCREEKTFSRNDALTRHMRVVHPEVETLGKRGRRGD